MTRIVVMVKCEECNGSGRFRYPSGRSDGLWLAVDCYECLGRGETESDDLSAKAQRVLEQLAEDSVDTNIFTGWFECDHCDPAEIGIYTKGEFCHADDCPHVLAKEVLG